jgi:hypothetical protein
MAESFIACMEHAVFGDFEGRSLVSIGSCFGDMIMFMVG